MVVFKKIRWKNLLSTGNTFTEIDVISHKSSLIVGDNGAGKSTILDALSFGLYGKPFRKVNKPQLINSINGKNLEVEIEFEIGSKNYLVRRGQKPNLFEIYQNKTLINQSADAKDYQDLLERSILKMNHKSFSQIVVLGSASFIPFMQLTAAHRREIIEDLLDIQIFTTMNTLLRDKMSKNKTDLLEIDYKIDGTQAKIDLEKAHLLTLEQNNDELIKQKMLQISDYEKKVNDANSQEKELQSEIAELQRTIADQDKVRSKMEKLSSLARQVRSKHDKIRKEAEFFDANHDCPTCRQGIAVEHRTAIVEEANAKLAEIKQGEEKMVEELDRLNSRLSDIAEILAIISTKTTEANSYRIRASQLDQFIDSIKRELGQLKENKQFADNKDRLNDLEQQQKGFEKDKERLIKERYTFEAASVLLKDNGIKSKIIKQYVPIINKLINKYLASMDFFVNFELNENFEEKIKSRFRDEFSYASFSEGEKSRLDLALLFTWRAVAKLRNSASTNLLILDEVFDGSLDNTGNDELLKILQNLVVGNHVFVISHKTDMFLDKFDRVLKFEKHKNFSRIMDV